MKVKIKKSVNEGLWYFDKIGQTVKVEEYNKHLYVLAKNHFYKLFKSDCVEVDKPKDKPKVEKPIVEFKEFTPKED